ncbi:hypothetical protein [Streptomyces sp. NPDC051364]|uniref:hypothetical protein n=1 Tax=Streptomyces sp. NPDC051364 TaxID=3155799 RepID=UPI0034409CFE
MQIHLDPSQEDMERLQSALGNPPPAEVARLAKIIAHAGAQEAFDYATGVAMPATMADLRAYRICRLVKAGMRLSEAESVVASLFKVAPASARRLVQTAVARFSVELGSDLLATVKDVLETAVWDEVESGKWIMLLPSRLVQEWALDRARLSDLPNPSRVRGALWHFSDETYQHLRELAGLPPRAKQ